MALIQTSLIWASYAVAIAILVLIASVFVYLYQTPRDRALSVTVVSIVSLTALLATILLLPVDVALVSSTIRSSEGVRKDWATERRVNNIVLSLKIVYYTLYSLDALLCLIVCPFTYFFYEEYDEVEAEEGRQTLTRRILGALKYTLIFVVLCVILLLVGLFVPSITDDKDKHKDLDYFKDLLTQNSGERSLAFTIGLLVTLGTILNIVYTSVGMAVLPIRLIWSAPALSMPKLAANTASELEQNRERQHQLEARSEGRQGGLDPRDRRELERLVRDERTLIRRERLAAEATGEGHALMKTWNKIGAIFRPVKLLAGIFLFLVSLVIFVSMLITGIDKASNSICKSHCGYILGHINIFQPINWIFVISAKAFPVDYVLFLLLVLYLFSSAVVGLASISIRFLFWPIFQIRRGHTSPQAILMATIMLGLIVLAINYIVALFVAPQYTVFGTQTFCDRPIDLRGKQPDCSNDRSFIKPCSELADHPAARDICTPTVVSTFINRITLSFPFFGVFDFWATFVFLGLFLIVAILSFFRPPKLGTSTVDEDLEEAEEEGLLSSTGRRFQATWEDITGRAQRNNPIPPSA